MIKLLSLLLILVPWIGLSNNSVAVDKERIEKLNSIFSIMASQGIDSKKPLLYSYFFIDKNQGNLENLKKRLLADNYRLVRLEKIEDEKVYILNVEKIEIHTPKSLHERENQLKNLMKEFKVELYGGWNVDLPDPTKSSASKGKSNKK